MKERKYKVYDKTWQEYMINEENDTPYFDLQGATTQLKADPLNRTIEVVDTLKLKQKEHGL